MFAIRVFGVGRFQSARQARFDYMMKTFRCNHGLSRVNIEKEKESTQLNSQLKNAPTTRPRKAQINEIGSQDSKLAISVLELSIVRLLFGFYTYKLAHFPSLPPSLSSPLEGLIVVFVFTM